MVKVLKFLTIQYSQKQPLSKRPKTGFQNQLSLNAGQKYSAILSTFIKLPFVIKIFVLSIFEWPLKTGFTVVDCHKSLDNHGRPTSSEKYFVITNILFESSKRKVFENLEHLS